MKVRETEKINIKTGGKEVLGRADYHPVGKVVLKGAEMRRSILELIPDGELKAQVAEVLQRYVPNPMLEGIIKPWLNQTYEDKDKEGSHSGEPSNRSSKSREDNEDSQSHSKGEPPD